MRTVFWVAAIIFMVDQVSKYLIVHVMNLKEDLRIDVFPPYLNLRMAWNKGINFGLFSSDNPYMPWVLIGIALAIVAFVLWWVYTDPQGRAQKVFAGVLIGGALGNVVDRVIYGAVADFLNMSCCGFVNPTAFNVADIAIFVGAFGLILFGSEKKSA